MHRLSGAAVAAASLCVVAAPAADALSLPLVGVAVTPSISDFSSTSPVKDSNSLDGKIGFFIPIKPYSSQTYGVNGGGLSQDTCYSSCGLGQLTMYLQYDTNFLGTHLLTMQFTDLDLA